jgi:hypothetical protein
VSGEAFTPAAGAAASNIGPNGSPIPADSALIGGENPSGNLVPVQVSAAGDLIVDQGAPGATSWPVVNTAGAAIIGKVGIDQTTPGTTNGVQVVAALPAGTNLLGKTGIDQTTQGTTNGVVLNAGTNVAGKFGIDQTTPGTTNGVQVIAALPAGTNTLGSVKITDGTSVPAVKAASTAPVATDPALVVTISPNSPAAAAPVNSNALYSSTSDTGITSATTETAPANAVGFILEASDQNTANIRWRNDGTAATSGHGLQLQSGRDSGFVPCSKSLSICPESGTQAYQLVWIKSS